MEPGVILGELPSSLSDALTLAENSPWIEKVIGSSVSTRYITQKRDEAAAFVSSGNKPAFYAEQYFRVL